MPVTDGAMDVFDRLPKALRKVLAEADHNWSGEQLYRARKRKHPAVHKLADAIAYIHAADKKAHDAAECGVMPGQR
jgi:collagenase-like PrtC family protease